MRYIMRYELTREGLLVYLANHYTTGGEKKNSLDMTLSQITKSNLRNESF